MNPHRPLCIDHTEVHYRQTLSIDHEPIPTSRPSTPVARISMLGPTRPTPAPRPAMLGSQRSSTSGPHRTVRSNYRASPFSSPSGSPSHSPPRSMSSPPLSSSGSFNDLDPDVATPSPHHRRVFAYDSDDNTPRTKSVKFVQGKTGTAARKTPPTPQPMNAGLSSSPVTMDSDSDSDDSDFDSIPKPAGEVGRPGRGGYNLRTALSWSDSKYNKIKTYINDIVEDELDCWVPFSEQPLRNLEVVRDKARKRYAILGQYRNDWATDDFIRTRLKYRKSALQKESMENELADVRSKPTTKTQLREIRKRKGKDKEAE